MVCRRGSVCCIPQPHWHRDSGMFRFANIPQEPIRWFDIRSHEVATMSAWHDAMVIATGTARRRRQAAVRRRALRVAPPSRRACISHRRRWHHRVGCAMPIGVAQPAAVALDLGHGKTGGVERKMVRYLFVQTVLRWTEAVCQGDQSPDSARFAPVNQTFEYFEQMWPDRGS